MALLVGEIFGACSSIWRPAPITRAQQPQIVVADHAGTQQCTACHNAHSPKISLAVAAPATPRGDATVGKVKAAACAGCHGAEGVSENLPGPSLAGQNEGYFIEALKSYSTSARDNPMMSAAATGTSTEDTANLAAYFAGLKCESALTPEKQAVSAGQESRRAIQELSYRCLESIPERSPQECHDG